MSHEGLERVGCVAIALVFSIACGGQTSARVGGETHWLSACTEDTDCGGGYQCLCGVCTLACESNASCSDIGESAECLDVAASSVADSCSSSGPPTICLRPEMSTPVDTGAPEAGGACNAGEVRLEDTCVTCDERWRLETEAMRELVSRPEWLSCTEDTDCMIVHTSTACEQRGTAVLATASQADFMAAKDALEQELCIGPDATTLCAGGTEDGVWPSASRCDRGTCIALYPVEGQRIDTEQSCKSSAFEAAGYAACIPGDTSVTLALDPEGQCWFFPTTCIPDGFVVAIEGGSCQDVSDPCCADRTEDACESDGACVRWFGNPAATDGTCYEASSEYAGCISANISCTGVEVSAVDADGACWRFTSGCFPATYRSSEDGECPALLLCQ
jgi:hypothetical protein